ncbi:MAG: suppressor of fused domain protein [Planctomycetes bacterium]|nr:suppressor of fused domain protein [Planctomycetota bacterium]
MRTHESRHRALTKLREAAYEKLFGVAPSIIYPFAEFTPKDDEQFLVDVYVFTMEGPEGDFDVAVTNGMSDQRMVNRKKPEQWARRELIQYLRQGTKDHAHRLNEMAWVPRFDGFLIDAQHFMSWERPAVKGTPWRDAFYLEPIVKSHQKFSMRIEDDPVRFLWHIPISAVECEYKRQKGADALIDRMQEVNLPWIFDEANRPALAMEADLLVPVFMPSLAASLLAAEKAEREKGKRGGREPIRTSPSPLSLSPLLPFFMVDVRDASRQIQEIAFNKGLIPYIPADRQGQQVRGQESKVRGRRSEVNGDPDL